MLDTNYQKIGYDTTILLIDKKCETCETWDALFAIKEFIDLYEHSSFYIADALLFISNDRYNDKQKKICICSMQKTTLDDYINILRKCQILYDSDAISEDVLEWAVSPNFSNRYLIVRNFKEEKVRKILNQIHEDQKTPPQLKEKIEDILSGALWENIKASEGN